MLELMTVNDVQSPVSLEADQDLNGFTILKKYRVLPAALPREYDRASTGPRLHLERGAMHVNRMRRIMTGRELPTLGLPEGYLEVDAVQVVHLTIDFAHPLELEYARDDRIRQT